MTGGTLGPRVSVPRKVHRGTTRLDRRGPTAPVLPDRPPRKRVLHMAHLSDIGLEGRMVVVPRPLDPGRHWLLPRRGLPHLDPHRLQIPPHREPIPLRFESSTAPDR